MANDPLVESGALPDNPVPDPNQDLFLNIILSAYLATMDAGTPREDYLTTAEEFANRIIEAHENAGTDYYMLAHGIIGTACLQLALARQTLRRISISLSEGNIITLIFRSNGIGLVEVDLLGHTRAVVYMDDGEYSVVKHFADGTESAPVALVVAGDAEVEL